MNIFRMIGDMSHLASFMFLVNSLWERKSAAGISLKTQELYLLVFVTRYLDLFSNFHSLYNTCMKMVYLIFSAGIVWLLRTTEPWKTSYLKEKKHDTFRHVWFAIAPCAVLALFFNEGWSTQHWHGWIHLIFEIFWAFSIYLEAVAIAPQLILLQRHRSVENLTGWYVFSLGCYRFFYLLNWLYRFFTEPHYSQWIAWLAGMVQTLLYVDFFYYFWLSKRAGLKDVVLPQ